MRLAVPYQTPSLSLWERARERVSWLGPACIVAASLALYVSTRSISLDDFDSFNFARALGHFDVSANQPQPPGYPLYVLLGRAFLLAFGDAQTALTVLSAVCGAGAVLAFYLLTSDLGAPWAAVPLVFAPLWWLSSEMALSDVPGLFVGTLAVLLLERAVRNTLQPSPPTSPRGSASRTPWVFVLACAVTGLAIGIRPQAAVVPLAVLVFWSARRVPWKVLAFGIGALVATCIGWGIPFLLTFASPMQATRLMLGQGQYVGGVDSLLARPLTVDAVEARLAEFGSVFGSYFGGPSGAGLAAFSILTGILVVLAALCRREARGLALAWLVPNAALMLLAMRPDDPRKVLPVLPPMFLLLGGVRPAKLAVAGCIAAGGWLAFSALPLIREITTEPSPPEQAAAYIAGNFSASNTAVIAGLSFNAVRYMDPAFRTYLVDQNPQLERSYDNLIVLDKEGFTVPESYVGADSRTFERDPLVLPKASTVWMAVYHPIDNYQGRDLTLPSGPIPMGTPDDVRYLMDGWYRPEEIAGVAARWTDRQAKVRFWVDQARDANLAVIAAAYPAGEQLTLSVNGQQAAKLALAQGWAPYNISLPAALFHAEAINTLTLEHSLATSAYDATQGQSLDHRPLAAAYSTLELQWR